MRRFLLLALLGTVTILVLSLRSVRSLCADDCSPATGWVCLNNGDPPDEDKCDMSHPICEAAHCHEYPESEHCTPAVE